METIVKDYGTEIGQVQIIADGRKRPFGNLFFKVNGMPIAGYFKDVRDAENCARGYVERSLLFSAHSNKFDEVRK